VSEAGGKRSIARHALTGAILGTLCAVAAHVLGVQQLLRSPGLVLYIPAAAVGAILGVSRLRPLLWIGAGIIALICIAVAYTPIVSTLAGQVVRGDRIPPRVDAIAVLSAGFSSDGMMRSETLDRLLTGLALAKQGVGATLLVSRERRNFGEKVVSDSADQQSLLSLAQPSAQIIFVDSVVTTRTEALRMKAIAQAHGWLRIAVVTSPMHTRRACATFERVGFNVVCVPAAVRGSGLHEGSSAEDRLRSFRSWLYETFATSSYRRLGWIG
jgi:uncharacterized SAM-binding protein YcdF (DUF218 family)